MTARTLAGPSTGLTEGASRDTLPLPMESPSEALKRARTAAERRPRRAVSVRDVDGLRRAILDVYRKQSVALSKLLADGRASGEEKRVSEEALARLGRYYGVACTYQGGDAGIERRLHSLRASLEERAKSQELAALGETELAREALERAGERLREVAPTDEAGAAEPVHAAVDVVFEPATGTSRYDGEACLTFALRCPASGCKQTRTYRLLPGHATHGIDCDACKKPFLVYVGLLDSARLDSRRPAVHRLRARGVDGSAIEVVFEAAESDEEITFQDGDLVLLTYDDARRLRGVKNHSHGTEVLVGYDDRCFVATAAMGAHAEEVEQLRAFRDRVLLQSALGRAFVRLYYGSVGPALAGLVAAREERRRAAAALVRLAARIVRSKDLRRRR